MRAVSALMQADAIAREKGGKKEKQKQESAAAGGGTAGVGVGGVGVGSVSHSHTDTGYLWGNESATLECALRLVSAVASLGWQKQAIFFSRFFFLTLECALRLLSAVASLGLQKKAIFSFPAFFLAGPGLAEEGDVFFFPRSAARALSLTYADVC